MEHYLSSLWLVPQIASATSLEDEGPLTGPSGGPEAPNFEDVSGPAGIKEYT